MRPFVFVAGARPNFMKVAPIIRAIRARRHSSLLIHTGQHYDASMSDVFFEELGLRQPDAHFGVGSGTHAEQTAAVMVAMERYLLEAAETPAGIVVVGDVNSTVAAATAAAKLHVPVAHVEAGLRFFDRRMPEELNRLQTDVISDLLLVSEPSGEKNLEREGSDPASIRYVGNVMIDSLVAELATARSQYPVTKMGVNPNDFVVVTAHRPSNVDVPTRLNEIVELLEWVAERVVVFFPCHPRTRRALEAAGLLERLEANPKIGVHPPCTYRELLSLMSDSRAVITDSGGIQEETSFMGVPCFTIRPGTERPATVTHGTNQIVGNRDDLGRELMLPVIAQPRARVPAAIPGWDGHAGERIADILIAEWGDR